MSTDTSISDQGRRPQYAAVALTALSPILTVPWPGTSSLTASFVVLLVTAALWAWFLRGHVARVWASHRAFVTAVVVGMSLLLVSAVVSADPGSALTYGAENGYMALPSWGALALTFVGAAAVRLSRRVQLLLASAVVPVVAAAAFTSAQTLVFGRASDAPDYWSGVAVVLIPVALVQAAASRSLWTRGAWLSSVAVAVVSGLVTGSATFVLTLLTECLLLLVLAPRLLYVSTRVGRILAALLVTVAIAGVAVAVAAPQVLPEGLRAWTDDVLRGPTTLTRFDMWRIGWEVFRTQPLFGVGPDGLFLAGQRYLGEDLVRLEGSGYSGVNVFVRDPHLIPLYMLVVGGAFGAIAGLALCVTWVRSLRDQLRRSPRLASVRLAYATGAIGFLASLAVSPWSVRFVALPALLGGLALASAAAGEPGTAEPEAVGPRASTLPARRARIAAGLVIAVSCFLASTALLGDVLHMSVRGSRDPAVALDRVRVASLVQPTRPQLAFEALRRQGELLVSGSLSFAEYRRAVDDAPASVRLNAAYLVVLGRLALDHAETNGDPEAERWGAEVVKEAAASSPLHPDVLLEQVRLALDRGDAVAAGRALERCELLSIRKPRLALYEYRYRAATGDTQRAGRLGQQVRVMAPDLVSLLEATP